VVAQSGNMGEQRDEADNMDTAWSTYFNSRAHLAQPHHVLRDEHSPMRRDGALSRCEFKALLLGGT
jgi:hypothetical protein